MTLRKRRVCELLFDRDIKYRDLIIFALIAAIGYILIKNFGVLLAFLRHLFSILSPFLYALAIAYCLNPIMKVFEKRFRFKRGLSIASTYIFLSSLVVLIVFFILPSIISSIISIASEIPRYAQIIQGWIYSALGNETLYGLLNDVGLLSYLTELSSRSGTTIVRFMQGSLSSIFLATATLVRIIIGFLISIYVLLDKERLVKGTKIFIYMVIKEDKGHKLIEWMRIYNRMVGRYIGIKAVDSSIIGFIAFIGLILIKAPYPRLIALFVGITNMVPYVGPLVGQVVGAFIGLSVSPVMSITVFLFLFALQQFDAWYLDPKLVGHRVGVRPFFIILALIIGGGYFGIIGMLLASPTIATLKIFYDKRVAVFKASNSSLMEHIEN
jgi:predicted PurR-regulated permease PerM